MSAQRAELPALSDDVLQRMGMTREGWERVRTAHREREERAPQVGSAAPDFELPYLDDKSRTARLSRFRGERPVALIFGSYT